jgi:hypothetical protein
VLFPERVEDPMPVGSYRAVLRLRLQDHGLPPNRVDSPFRTIRPGL